MLPIGDTHILNVSEVKEILEREPGAIFSLQPVKVKFTDGPGHIVAGYHIFEGEKPNMHVCHGPEIWKYVKEP